jgi:hypothetical protein
MKKWWLLLFFILFVIRAEAQVSCNMTASASCSEANVLLYIQNDTGGFANAHAQSVGYTDASYANVMCCNATNQNLTTTCGTTFLKLSNSTNAHVQDINNSGFSTQYSTNACLSDSTALCNISSFNCANGYDCIASIASTGSDNRTDAHIGQCGDYGTKICCAVDITAPTSFSVNGSGLTPSNNTLTNDTSPSLSWEATTEPNLENYTLYISTSNIFAANGTNSSITYSYSSLTNFFDSWTESLSVGNWYWRITAYDVLSNSYQTETFAFTVTAAGVVQNIISETTVTGGGGGGAAGGKKIDKRAVFNLLYSDTVSIFVGDTIKTRLTLENAGSAPLKNIKLTAEKASSALDVKIEPDAIPLIDPGQSAVVEVSIRSIGTQAGAEELVLSAEVEDPPAKDEIRYFIGLLEFGAANKTLVEPKLVFVDQMLEANTDCLELREAINDARKALAENDRGTAEKIIDEIINSCSAIIASRPSQEKILPKIRNINDIVMVIGETLLFLILFGMMYQYYKKKKIKQNVRR